MAHHRTSRRRAGHRRHAQPPPPSPGAPPAHDKRVDAATGPPANADDRVAGAPAPPTARSPGEAPVPSSRVDGDGGTGGLGAGDGGVLGRRSAAWRQAVLARATRLECELERIEVTTLDERRKQVYDHASKRIATARAIATDTRSSIPTWLSGKLVELAWSELRPAEEALVDLADAAEVPALAADAVAHAKYYLKVDDERLIHLTAVRQQYAALTDAPGTAPLEVLRSATRATLIASHEHATILNRSVRTWRNLLLAGSCFLFAATAATVVTAWRVPAFQFIDAPTSTDAAAAAAGTASDPRQWVLMITVAAFAVLGAILSAVPAMTRTPANRGPYNLPLQQALLKMAFGPVSAFAGLALVTASGVADATDWPTLVVLAIAFGAAQHAVTRAVDARAEQAIIAASPTQTQTDAAAGATTGG